MTIEPDTKDWTWVLNERCPECGFDATKVDDGQLAHLFRANAVGWLSVLARDDASVRPGEAVWSPLEYACHVRDVHRVFLERVQLMLKEDDPGFANWDQDQTAIDSDYGSQDPMIVATELVEAAEIVAEEYAAVTREQWQRPGTRSNGSKFTVDTLGRYHLHDAVHHLYDVRG
ncbi:MAG TPA: DinB family protein [Nocardioidaceae bacterium]|nr:DinB family protein [Nocardioidaceae bacterium]